MTLRRLALSGAALAAGLTLSACGFSPLYSTTGYERLSGLAVEAGPERFDYYLQNAVRDFTGPGDSAHVLRVATEVSDRPVGVSPTGEATRVNLTGRALYTLEGPGEPITGERTATIAFDQPRDPYALLAARGEAEERLAERLAEEVVQTLTVQLRRREAGLTQ
ncbi:MAG: LPS assembly lipoprotein LptE [Oceanicaulis sp.]